MNQKKILFLFAIFFSFHIQTLASEKFEEEFKKSELYKFYQNYLKNKKLFQSGKVKWSHQVISNLDLIPEASGPSPQYYNSSIIWVNLAGSKIGFRPIDTVTGCSSGCTPVVFHLVIDEKGNASDILTEPSKPLRKIWHTEFSVEDMKKVLNVARLVPEKLAYIDHPSDLTDNKSSFPPQTWTFFQDTLVKGGAYTSFVIYDVSVKTKQVFNTNPKDKAVEQKEMEKISALFSQKITNQKQLISIVDNLQKIFNEKITIKSKKVILRYFLGILDYFLLYLEDGFSGSKEEIKSLDMLIENLNFYGSFYTSSFQSMFYDFLLNIFRLSSGRFLLSELPSKFKYWKFLPENLQAFLPFLAKAKSDDKTVLKKDLKKLNKQQLLEYVSSNSFLLLETTKIFYNLEDYAFALKARARLEVRYPNKDVSTLSSWEKKHLIDYQKLKMSELDIYISEISREFLNSNSYIKPVVAEKFHSIKPSQVETVKLPIHPTKQMYIFFAPWCGHCYQLLGALAKSAPNSFWDKVQLVSIFTKDKNMLSEFVLGISLEKHAPKAFKELLVLGEDSQSQAFYDDMNIFAVPKIVVTNTKGEIINYSYDLDTNSEVDFNRDFELILKRF